MEKTLVGALVKIIKILFCVKDDESDSKLKRDHKKFFPILPTEIIQYIGDFLDPLAIITLSRTCKEAQMIFSNNYWAYKCQVEKLPPCGRDISPEKVYVANFWYKTQLPVMLKKAASMGHPESQKILKSMQPNNRTNKLQPSKF